MHNFWANCDMTEEDVKGPEGTKLDGEGLQDQIGHWMVVLDRWIKQFDRGMGGQQLEKESLDGADGHSGPPLQVEDYGRDPSAGADRWWGEW